MFTSYNKFYRHTALQIGVLFLGILFTLVPFKNVLAAQKTNEDTILIAPDALLPLSDMDSKRGSGGISNTIDVSSNQTLSSTSTGNTVNVGGNLTNGSITTNGSVSGSGFGSYVLNTGNNATINSGVSLSVLSLH